jgi:hypothetical protein
MWEEKQPASDRERLQQNGLFFFFDVFRGYIGTSGTLVVVRSVTTIILLPFKDASPYDLLFGPEKPAILALSSAPILFMRKFGKTRDAQRSHLPAERERKAHDVAER